VEQLCHDYLDAGSAGIVALGTTGEATALDAAEQRAVIDACARVCAARDAQLIVGAGTNSTAKTIAAVEGLAGTPALTAALIVVPYYVRPSEAGIVAHYQAVADASPVPVVVYNIPIRTGRNLGPAGMLELAHHPRIIGVKQAVGALDADTLEILAGAPADFAVLGGDDPFLFPTVLMGGAGAICASAHLCTERFVAMIECGLAGKVDDGRAHAEALLPVVQACFAEPNPAVFKGVLHTQGRIPTPDVRLPLVAASSGAVDAALAAVEAVR
jgi:4-hydroxy-tetrahydrodipicolinate synthase